MANATDCYLESIIAVVNVVIKTVHFSDMKIHIHSEAASERSDRGRIKVKFLIYVQ